jgi:hypothetical protein
MYPVRLTACLAAALTGSTALAASTAPNYRVLDRIAGPDGSWDYARVDPANNRVLAAGSTIASLILLPSLTWRYGRPPSH